MEIAPSTSSDVELLRLMLAGDGGAFEQLYQRWQSPLYRFALRMSGSETIAEDVTQREVVLLCYLHELSYAEAAEVIGCELGTVRSRLHRARALLAEKLDAMKTADAPQRNVNLSRRLHELPGV
jgi:DNA-directed RNA polymerase specialized sigma24 family protein